MSRGSKGTGQRVDVLVVGAGMVGLAAACALARAGFRVAVIDRVDPRALQDETFDGRASAIALASSRLLDAIGAWPEMSAEAQAILEIRVSDGHSPLFLHFDHREVGPEPHGWMVENRFIRRAMSAAAERAGVAVRAPALIETLERNESGVVARLADGTTIAAMVCLAADGGRSRLREQAGIPSLAWRYPQTGLVCTVAHERPHRGIAQERFLPSGPFAILPLSDNRSSLVWTERNELAAGMLALDDAAFDAEIARRFGDYLGAVRSTGPRWSYPLAFRHAERYVDRRLALIGDAAHTVHPIAGQGLNMGLRDVAALVEVVIEARRLGLDVGRGEVLARYERWRRVDNMVLMAATDSLNRLFSNDVAPVRLARDLGLAAVNELAPLKRFFMHHARGEVGKLPKLLRGEAP